MLIQVALYVTVYIVFTEKKSNQSINVLGRPLDRKISVVQL